MPFGPFWLRWPLRWPVCRPETTAGTTTGSEAASAQDSARDQLVKEAEILARYEKGLGRAIVTVKQSVGRQKGNIYRRWVRARWWMFAISASILFVSTGATIFGALGLNDVTAANQLTFGKVMRVALPALIGLLAALETLFDTRGRYVREAEAQLNLTRLQSDIEYALVWDTVPATDGKYRITFDTVDNWKSTLDSILDNVSKEYISANSKAAARKSAA